MSPRIILAERDSKSALEYQRQAFPSFDLGGQSEDQQKNQVINLYRMNMNSMGQDRKPNTGYSLVRSSKGVCIGIDTNSMINTGEIDVPNSYNPYSYDVCSRRIRSGLDNIEVKSSYNLNNDTLS